MTGSLVVDAVAFGLAVLLPGVLLVRAALPDADGFLTLGGGLTLGLFLIPLLSYAAAVVLRTHVSVVLIAAVGAVLSLPPGVLLWRRAKRHTAGS